MLNPNRVLAAGLLFCFGAAATGYVLGGGQVPSDERSTPLRLLPTALANPAEVAFEDTLRRGETLSDLLRRSDLAEGEASLLLQTLMEHQDPRRLREGAVLSYRKSFSSGELRGAAMNLDSDRMVSVRRDGEALEAAIEEVPVRTDTTVLTGSVKSSLYAALLGADESDVPASERQWIVDVLADRIFAWQIDFSRDLRPGDEFRILYERMVRPDGTARTSRVLSVQFDLSGTTREAYLFSAPDGTEDYFDREGESLRRAFLRAPLEFRRITSAFSKSRFHPVLRRSRPHHGIDYAASTGTPIRAVGDGVVAKAGWGGGYGQVVEIRHSRGYGSRYAHLSRYGAGIRAGARVKQGDVIGYVGSTGLATGPHLHYEFHSNGRPVDPNTIRSITGDPVPSRYRARFRGVVGTQIAALERRLGEAKLAASPAASRVAAAE